jgi:hypothetical protein
MSEFGFYDEEHFLLEETTSGSPFVSYRPTLSEDEVEPGIKSRFAVEPLQLHQFSRQILKFVVDQRKRSQHEEATKRSGDFRNVVAEKLQLREVGHPHNFNGNESEASAR